jgi:hypothetical protein
LCTFKASYTVKKGYRFSVPSRDVTNQIISGEELLNYSGQGKTKTITFFTVHEVGLKKTQAGFLF